MKRIPRNSNDERPKQKQEFLVDGNLNLEKEETHSLPSSRWSYGWKYAACFLRDVFRLSNKFEYFMLKNKNKKYVQGTWNFNETVFEKYIFVSVFQLIAIRIFFIFIPMNC